jgi:hypothetical protein
MPKNSYSKKGSQTGGPKGKLGHPPGPSTMQTYMQKVPVRNAEGVGIKPGSFSSHAVFKK